MFNRSRRFNLPTVPTGCGQTQQAAVAEQNSQAPAGTIGLLPVPDNQEKQFTGKMEGRLSTVEDFENVIVKTTPDGLSA